MEPHSVQTNLKTWNSWPFYASLVSQGWQNFTVVWLGQMVLKHQYNWVDSKRLYTRLTPTPKCCLAKPRKQNLPPTFKFYSHTLFLYLPTASSSLHLHCPLSLVGVSVQPALLQTQVGRPLSHHDQPQQHTGEEFCLHDCPRYRVYSMNIIGEKILNCC